MKSKRPASHTTNVTASPIADSNRDLVLEVLRRNQPISRVDVARRSGLQRSTISMIVDGLIEEGWVREGSVLKTARGRRPTMLTMNEDLAILVADIRPTQAILAVIDLNGRFLDRAMVPIVPDPKAGVKIVIEGLQDLRSRFRDKIFEGVGISLPGRVAKSSQKLALAPNLPWIDFDLRGAIQKALGLQVELENAANAAMLSEVWFGNMEGIRNAVLITVSEGIGAAILSNGQLQEGANGLAGELGHIPISEAGPRCACGQTGCWETFASSRAALRLYREGKPKRRVNTIHDLLSMAANGDSSAQRALRAQATAIGRGLRIVTAAFDPQLILFVGDLTLHWKLVGNIIEGEMKQRLLAPPAPRIAPLPDGEAARLRGAAAVVLQRHTRYKRTGTLR